MALALLCSGQGWQHAGMFALTADAPQAAGLFTQAKWLFDGRDPRAFVGSEGLKALHRNREGQLLCVLQALAAAAALQEAWPDRVIIAGYSVGEMAAWGVAGCLDAGVVLDLVRLRAETMDAASAPDDGLLSVRGLPASLVNALCERHGVAIAIVNPANTFVLGGSRKALRAAADDARRMNAARVVDIPVEVASHTPRLARARTDFRRILQTYPLARPVPNGNRLLSGVDGTPVSDAETGLDKLADQLCQTVQWSDCLQGCVEGGATRFLELGPGSALSAMVTAAYPGLAARSLEEFRTLEGARAWLGFA
ncbi:acyltransferase domain-containing protein [Variovorax sp. J22P168]|uniref:acyltransferase domain-containing protein n=1 Tax=Variovorax jilinensis TaxID=3053513 RepID=UPI0025760C6B|nr:acyltransferase domain-containing protein [Variovorax sp. J22P168]MDM0015228.1 acyltransferase domain-containing protein [Variovorax sp. J22P168]